MKLKSARIPRQIFYSIQQGQGWLEGRFLPRYLSLSYSFNFISIHSKSLGIYHMDQVGDLLAAYHALGEFCKLVVGEDL